MQYLMLIYLRDAWRDLPNDDKNRIHAQCGAWHDELVKSGHSRGAFGLQPAATATTLRADDGTMVLSDGPFMETKEMLGGFEIVECRDLDEALAIARRFPALQSGCCAVEIRPTVTGECRD